MHNSNCGTIIHFNYGRDGLRVRGLNNKKICKEALQDIVAMLLSRVWQGAPDQKLCCSVLK